MKDSDKGLLAVAVVVGYLYMTKKEPSAYVDPVGGGIRDKNPNNPSYL